MKIYIKKIGILFFATFILISCNEDFLDRYPLDELSNETFWKTENDLLVYNNSIYDLSKKDSENTVLFGHDNLWRSSLASYQYLDAYTDNLAPPAGEGSANRAKDVRAGIQIPGGRNSFGYQGWDFLRAVNVGLDNYQNATSLDQTVINKYAAEARMFRAWFYYNKVSLFGDNQWIDTELTTESPELFGERDPRDFVMEKVLEDINFAVANIPTDWGLGEDPGRLNYWDALALKARICLFEGTWQKYHGGSNANMWLQQAADAAKTLMNNGGFTLNDTGDPATAYNDLHRSQDLTGNPEIIHWVKYETGIRNNNIMKYYVYNSGGATKSAVEDYLCLDGLPISLSPQYAGDEEIEDVFINRDPRLRQTVLAPADKDYYEYNKWDVNPYPRFANMNMSGGKSSGTGYHMIKTYVASVHAGAHNSGSTPGVVFRLGETFLIYAEALAELGTITQEDLDVSINLLRDRVDLVHLTMNPPMDPRYANEGISSLLVEIRRERRVELFSEGFRYEDIRRWKQGSKLNQPDLGLRWNEAAIARYPTAEPKITTVDGKAYVDPYKDTSWGTPSFDESKDYLWPIPLTDLSENPNLGQNPGW
ncbi:RagB/SusD family nutrient uptake outer membrane protein [Formosa sp. PL04]|uniref:RagB/SusD family nutrient uptake outer membrane protein n=1 Tax=Formosa sp. PL04 TaxID=3081755 RepID=UPI00298179C6|nr:RagB/SusD family nutrient uptake outer membrane protein [Formosa sp. PL04]MDW5288130.1 RagB/SusD family nutrient uptake outer membrane protein [Formosa sp. PL04]